MINPISDGRTATTDLSGILSQWVLQPTDNAPAESRRGEPTYREQFKGPYSKGKEILSQFRAGDKLDFVHNKLGNINFTYTVPASPLIDGKQTGWIVESINVVEGEAGDHCTLDINYRATTAGFGDLTILTSKEERDVWTCNWQSYTVSPYAFCSNKEHLDDVVSPGANGTEYLKDWSKPAMRQHIDSFRNNVENKIHQVNGACIYNQAQQRYYLNPTEVEINKKIDLGKSAVYHYPILTHTTVKEGYWSGQGSVLDYDSDIGNEIDCLLKQNALSGCPFDFDTDPIDNREWKWIKVGDDITLTKNKKMHIVSYERKETFWGFKELDQNFYGRTLYDKSERGILSGRWIIGEL